MICARIKKRLLPLMITALCQSLDSYPMAAFCRTFFAHFFLNFLFLLLRRRFLQQECSNWKFMHKDPISLAVLEDRLTYKLQGCTQGYGHRPFGVGLLIAGVSLSVSLLNISLSYCSVTKTVRISTALNQMRKSPSALRWQLVAAPKVRVLTSRSM